MMLQRMILSMVISYAMKQLAKYTNSIDWVKLKADLNSKIKTMVPIAMLDDEAISIADTTLDTIHSALGQTDKIHTLLSYLADHQWVQAEEFLKTQLTTFLTQATKVVADSSISTTTAQQNVVKDLLMQV